MIRWGWLLGLICGCADDTRRPVDVRDSGDDNVPEVAEVTTGDEVDTDVDDAVDSADARDTFDSAETTPVDDWTDLVGSYNLLVTVAGRGAERDLGVEWKASYEGGAATQAELSRPHIAMGDLAGNIYIADKEAHAVRKVDPNGVITTIAGTNVPGDDGDTPGPGVSKRLGDPNGLWVKPDGTVYILDLDNGKIRKWVPDGTLTTLFAVPGGIDTGRGLWVSDDETRAYVASGTQVLIWEKNVGVRVLARGFVSLGNLALDPVGRLVVTDRGGHRVFRVDGAGNATPIAGNGTIEGGGDGLPALESGLEEVRGVWFRPSGGYLLGTHEGNKVWYVDTAGILHLFLDGGGNHAHGGDGLFFRSPGEKVSEVRAVTVDPLGRILVTENDFGYVRAVLPSRWRP